LDKPIYSPILALAGIFGIRMLGLFMILPVFALYTRQFTGVTPFRIGIALGVYGLTQAIFQIPFGLCSDKFGRKPVIIFGLLLFSLGSAIAASSDSIDGIILGRFLQGSGAIGSVIMALAADLSSATWRSRAMAIIGITIGLAFALAFILGPILTELFQGIKGLFWLTAGLSLFCIGLLIAFVPTPELSHMQTKRNPSQASRMAILKNKKLMSLNLGVLVIHASLTALFLKIPGIVEGLGFSNGGSWQIYCPVLLIALFVCMPMLYGLDKLSTKPPLYLKISLLSVILLLVSSESLMGFFHHHPSIFALGLCLFFTAFNVLEAGLPSLITQIVGKDLRGTTMGVYSSLQFLGLFLGGFLGGFLDNYYGLSAILLLCFILALIWFIICWLLF
jgi:MFS family permease